MGDKFEGSAFFAALDAVRLVRGLNWKEVAEQSGVHASTLTRMGKGKHPDVDGLAALLVWSNLRAESFIQITNRKPPEPIAQIASLIRMDKSLTYSNARLMEDIVTSTYNRLKREKK